MSAVHMRGDVARPSVRRRWLRQKFNLNAHVLLAKIRESYVGLPQSSCLLGHTRQFELLHAQAHDFEAYQELLRETAGPGSAVERYEVISKFLSDTEDYLHKLAAKVASVKLSQEASEAAAAAIAEARAQVRGV